MIIPRYLSKEVLQTTFAVTSVLLVIIMSGRFVKYLAEAAAGKIDASVLFAVMFYRLPGFMELILPLGFFVSILLAYGRLYTDSEMTVLFSCGMSRKQLIQWTYIPAVVITLIIASLSLWLTPLGLHQAEKILAQQQARNDFETMQEARFQVSRNKDLVSYTEDVSDNREQLNAFFLASMNANQNEALMTVRSKVAEYKLLGGTDQRYLVLKDGTRYEGQPGQANYRITEFEEFGQHIDTEGEIVVVNNKVNRLPTLDLMGSSLPEYQAALQWRLSSPFVVLIVTLLGVVFSHTNPRRGRYAMLFPAILLYLIYLVLLNSARGAVEEQRLSPLVGLWAVHGGFLVLAIGMLFDKKQWLAWSQKLIQQRIQQK
ncbi:MAG: lipopolysaccharide export system permease protein [Candidatus Endobugula sp.]|jgi:lipopolysaccharide export system permease protein